MRAPARLSLSRNESVDVLRKKIDQIDEKVLSLLNDRAFLAQKISRSKSQNNQEVYVPHREKQILQRLSRLNQGPLPEHSIRAIFREVVSACRSIEAPLKIAFFGAEGTYSHLAPGKIRFHGNAAAEYEYQRSVSGGEPRESVVRGCAD